MYILWPQFCLLATATSTIPLVSTSVTVSTSNPAPGIKNEESSKEKETTRQEIWTPGMNEMLVIGGGVGGALMALLIIGIIARICLRQQRLVSSGKLRIHHRYCR